MAAICVISLLVEKFVDLWAMEHLKDVPDVFCYFQPVPLAKHQIIQTLRQYHCWHLFVKVCYLFCRRTVTDVELQQADDTLGQFWKAYKELYGSESCTINIHLHGHLSGLCSRLWACLFVLPLKG